MSQYHDRASAPPRLVDGPGCTPTRVVAVGNAFQGSLRAALGCTETNPQHAEFWVQTNTWAQPACGQHVGDVLRRALDHDGKRAVLVDKVEGDRPCHVAGAPYASAQQERAELLAQHADDPDKCPLPGCLCHLREDG